MFDTNPKVILTAEKLIITKRVYFRRATLSINFPTQIRVIALNIVARE